MKHSEQNWMLISTSPMPWLLRCRRRKSTNCCQGEHHPRLGIIKLPIQINNIQMHAFSIFLCHFYRLRCLQCHGKIPWANENHVQKSPLANIIEKYHKTFQNHALSNYCSTIFINVPFRPILLIKCPTTFIISSLT